MTDTAHKPGIRVIEQCNGQGETIGGRVEFLGTGPLWVDADMVAALERVAPFDKEAGCVLGVLEFQARFQQRMQEKQSEVDGVDRGVIE